MNETIIDLCTEAGVSDEDTARIVDAAMHFQDDELKLRTARLLIDAWKNDRAAV